MDASDPNEYRYVIRLEFMREYSGPHSVYYWIDKGEHLASANIWHATLFEEKPSKDYIDSIRRRVFASKIKCIDVLLMTKAEIFRRQLAGKNHD